MSLISQPQFSYLQSGVLVNLTLAVYSKRSENSVIHLTPEPACYTTLECTVGGELLWHEGKGHWFLEF